MSAAVTVTQRNHSERVGAHSAPGWPVGFGAAVAGVPALAAMISAATALANQAVVR
ncbi:hypothetical protein [Micromonospora citrea]|uniref:hypothetical protein n=1 Tax=Micromonospora citrea TaxID=47855 RepID=UPI00159F333C|nr:hypothetical protein [Micromonospora citrea]